MPIYWKSINLSNFNSDFNNINRNVSFICYYIYFKFTRPIYAYNVSVQSSINLGFIAEIAACRLHDEKNDDCWVNETPALNANAKLCLVSDSSKFKLMPVGRTYIYAYAPKLCASSSVGASAVAVAVFRFELETRYGDITFATKSKASLVALISSSVGRCTASAVFSAV